MSQLNSLMFSGPLTASMYVAIKAPSNNEEVIVNRKGIHTINVQAVVEILEHCREMGGEFARLLHLVKLCATLSLTNSNA